jgi:alkylation response protein AidB-like acyl-CoA dehydrogenase
MSEPDAGSDLAAIRTRAVRDGDNWIVNGTKVWTSVAGSATHVLALFRTSEERHGGLTQFIVDMDTPGLSVRPIRFIDDSADFYELSFLDVVVPDSRRLGAVGAGWSQNVAELALERGGVDRWMSAMPILDEWIRRRGHDVEPALRRDIARVISRLWSFRQMSLSIARMVDQGRPPIHEAAIVKEMATRFEQECVDIVLRHWPGSLRLDSDDQFERLLARAVLVAPSWTIRGGTNEILRGIIARGLLGRGAA